MTEAPFKKVAIWGVGLIGGSLGSAIKARYPEARVVGIGRSTERLERARHLGVVDETSLDPPSALTEKDLVVLATHVEHILQILPEIGEYLSSGCLVTDVGSTKRAICSAAWENLPHNVDFVGGHPIAGKEFGGVDHSQANLFLEAPYVLTPKPGGRTTAAERLGGMIRTLGARPIILGPEQHDEILAWSSHLPQVLSTTFASTVMDVWEDPSGIAESSGGGLRDLVRLAGSPYAIWRGILETNGDNISRALRAYIDQLEEIRSTLGDPGIRTDFDRAIAFHRLYREKRVRNK